MYEVPWWWSIWIETCRQTCKVPYKIKSVHLLVTKVIITKMHRATHIKVISCYVLQSRTKISWPGLPSYLFVSTQIYYVMFYKVSQIYLAQVSPVICLSAFRYFTLCSTKHHKDILTRSAQLFICQHSDILCYVLQNITPITCQDHRRYWSAVKTLHVMLQNT
jgi:hypothetical protein